MTTSKAPGTRAPILASSPLDRLHRGCAIGIIVIGVIISIPVVIAVRNSIGLIQHGVVAAGRVVSVDPNGPRNRRNTVVEFHDRADRTRRITTSGSLQVGDFVEVLYDPSDPDRAVANGWPTTWGAVFLLPLFPIALIAFGRWFFRLSF